MIPLGTLASGRPSGLTLTHWGTWPVAAGASLTAVPIGNASATRTVLAVTTWATNLAHSIGSVKIGGVTATLDLDDTTNRSGVAVWRATIPTGTTADVVLTWDTSVPSTVAVLTAPTALTVVATAASPIATRQSTSTIALATATGGVLIAGAASGETGGGVTHSPSGTSIIAADRQAAFIYDTTGTPLTITNTLAPTWVSSSPQRNPLAGVSYAAS